MKLTSIVIPTFNGGELLQHCLYSIKHNTETPFEIIVVDDGSTDGTSEMVFDESVIYVSLSHNVGFPAACNLGMQIASGDELLLLNNDVLVSSHWLSNLRNCLYSSDNVGMVGPLSNYASGKQQTEHTFTTLDDMAHRMNQDNKGKYCQVERLIGLCLLFKRELMDRIGLLDERFSPGHYEDDDYCIRARQAGYRLMIAEDTFIYHQGSVSFNKQGEDKLKLLIARNHQKFIDKWGVDPHSFI